MKLIKIIFLFIFINQFSGYSQCNLESTICIDGTAGPFNFIPADANPSSCLDYWNGGGSPNYAYITLFITAPGDLNLLIQGNNDTGFDCLDVSVFDVTGEADPCNSLGPATEISCNYASACDACSEFGSTFAGCDSEIDAPVVNAGDILIILVEDWSDTQDSFTLELSDSPGSAQTGPGDPTISPAGPFSDSDTPYTMTAANGGGTWTASCGACINSVTGEFDPTLAGNGTYEICYQIGVDPCDTTYCLDVIVGPTCNMSSLTTATDITCPSTTYTTNGVLEFTTPPATGTLTVSDCNGNEQVFTAPFTSPINYSIPNQTADGLNCDITATFSDNNTCTITTTNTAPSCPCNIDVFTLNINACSPATNTFSVEGTIEFSTPPTTGTLIITVDDGTATYDTIITAADFISPLNYSISGIAPSGAASSITAAFSDDGACSDTQNYTAPANCNCVADIGTFNTSMIGDGQNNFILCYGDEFSYTSNGDWTAPADVNVNTTGPPAINYEPGIAYLIYSCPPTIGATPDNDAVTGDNCYEGIILDGTGALTFTDVNDLSMINAYPAGTFTNNIVYYVPVTMYDITNDWYTVSADPCYQMGPSVAVQYLPEIKTVEVENCQNGQIISTVTGGQSEIDGSNFTVVAGTLLPTNASFVNTTAVHGGTITIQGLSNGQNYSYDFVDLNGCPHTVSGTFNGVEDAGFNYSQLTFCSADMSPTINITGDPGAFTYTLISGGPTLTLDGVTGDIDISSSDFGEYAITYTTNDPTCFSDSTLICTIYETPTVNAVLDQTICAGDSFNDIIFTGNGSPAFDWTNDNSTTGLVSNGTGDILSFEGTNNSGIQATSSIQVTPSTAVCTGSSITFDLIVNPTENADFHYQTGLTYCITGTNPSAVVTGTNGGSFAYTVVTGGPTLAINTTTGDIDLLTSDLGSYNITYTTPGPCTVSTTLVLNITNSPVSNFSFGSYCINELNPTPNFDNDDSGTLYPEQGNGGVFSELTGNVNINPNTGLIDLNSSTPGIYTITNEINIPGCLLSSFSEDIEILALPTATITGDNTICPSGDLSGLNIQVDLNSNGPFDIYYNMNGTQQTNNSASPFIFSPSNFGTYTLDSITDVNGCSNIVTGHVLIDSFPTPAVHSMNNFIVCENESLTINNFVGFETGNTFHWNIINGTDIGFGISGSTLTGLGTFTGINPQVVTIEVTPESANGCFGLPKTFQIEVSPTPVAAFSVDIQSGCEPTIINFTNLSTYSDNQVWTFGNGSTTSTLNASYDYQNAGTYDIGLTVTSDDNCSNSTLEEDYITITPTPIASFALTPEITDISHTTVEFTNSSLDADYYEWNFGDETSLNNETNPTHVYPEVPAQYHITLLATNNNGLCRDSLDAYVTVNDIILYYIPNSFTPDQDAFNETFKPVFTSGFDPYDYHLRVFNRWGDLVFESYNAENGWNGKLGMEGELCPDGVYVWQIDFKETMSDKRHDISGYITLIK